MWILGFVGKRLVKYVMDI